MAISAPIQNDHRLNGESGPSTRSMKRSHKSSQANLQQSVSAESAVAPTTRRSSKSHTLQRQRSESHLVVKKKSSSRTKKSASTSAADDHVMKTFVNQVEQLHHNKKRHSLSTSNHSSSKKKEAGASSKMVRTSKSAPSLRRTKPQRQQQQQISMIGQPNSTFQTPVQDLLRPLKPVRLITHDDQSHSMMLENGDVLAWHGSKESSSCVDGDSFRFTQCLACKKGIGCIPTASYVLCPSCNHASPLLVDFNEHDEYHHHSTEGGIAIGISLGMLQQRYLSVVRDERLEMFQCLEQRVNMATAQQRS